MYGVYRVKGIPYTATTLVLIFAASKNCSFCSAQPRTGSHCRTSPRCAAAASAAARLRLLWIPGRGCSPGLKSLEQQEWFTDSACIGQCALVLVVVPGFALALGSVLVPGFVVRYPLVSRLGAS